MPPGLVAALLVVAVVVARKCAKRPPFFEALAQHVVVGRGAGCLGHVLGGLLGIREGGTHVV